MIGNLFTVVFVLGAMLVMSWHITLIALALLPLFLVPARMIGPRLRHLAGERYRLDAALAHMMTERFNVSGAMLAIVYGRPEDTTRAFASEAAELRDVGVAHAMYAGAFRVSMMLVAALAAALVYGLGGTLALRGELSVGTLVALTAYLGRLYGPLTAMSNVQVDVMTTLVSFERVFEVLDLAPMVADRAGARPLPPDAPASICPAAEDVSLASLESVAMLSPTPGTQVLITALVARLYDVTSGAVRIGGHDVRDLTQASLRDAIGVVSQDAHMFHATIRANLQLARPDAPDAVL